MSDVPSWLSEDNSESAPKMTSNPVAKKSSRTPPAPPAPATAPPPPPPAAAAAARDVETGPVAKPAAAVSSGASDFVIEESVLKSMQSWHLGLRVCYMGAAVFLAAAAALSLQKQGDVGLAFFAVYVFIFAALICCFEVALNMISREIAINFGFMYTLTGRAIFLLFVGFMSYSLSLLGKIAMGCLYGVGLFHVYLMYKFPRFEEYLRKKHYYEGRKASGNV